ncbi:MAG: sensor histidine kinase [Selenomonadaceae bacterium]|nr:sensor histidine kinase [Selenomonadaceae bacterium]
MILTGVVFLLAQISGVYLRYLPFSAELSAEETSRLWKYFLLWSLVNLAIGLWIFSDEMTYRRFKIELLLGWLPYFLISMATIRRKIPQHIFVFGMQALWCFTLHAFGGMGVAIIYGQMSEEYLSSQLGFYMLFFTILLPLEQKFFKTLLPSEKLFENAALRWGISFLPAMIFLGLTIQIIDITFLSTWKDRFARLIVPVFFFMVYRSLSLATQQVEEKQLNEQKNQLLMRQMESMSEQNALMEKNQAEVAELRQNLAANYLKIEKLLVENKKAAAMEFIRRQTNLLDSTRIKMFCKSPLINAALSIYTRRAEKLKIKISLKIDLPVKITTDENDLAVLVSNLLENAITASLEQKNPADREISLIMRQTGGQNVLEVGNRYDSEVKIGENGLPYTNKAGHGLGMASLEIFAKKYSAFTDFSQENGFVWLSLYWND